jgi:hypothetical protein
MLTTNKDYNLNLNAKLKPPSLPLETMVCFLFFPLLYPKHTTTQKTPKNQFSTKRHQKTEHTPKFKVDHAFHLFSELKSTNAIRLTGSFAKEPRKHHQRTKKNPERTQMEKAKK